VAENSDSGTKLSSHSNSVDSRMSRVVSGIELVYIKH
jgi:hypothetical protein